MKGKIPTSGGENLANNPFASLDLGPLPAAPASSSGKVVEEQSAKAQRKLGKIHLRIERAGRGGKTVTVIFGEGVSRLDSAAQSALLRELKNTLGCGGATGQEPGTLELQGDERERAAAWLRRAGFVV
mgnify:CR=1 FL=1